MRLVKAVLDRTAAVQRRDIAGLHESTSLRTPVWCSVHGTTPTPERGSGDMFEARSSSRRTDGPVHGPLNEQCDCSSIIRRPSASKYLSATGSRTRSKLHSNVCRNVSPARSLRVSSCRFITKRHTASTEKT